MRKLLVIVGCGWAVGCGPTAGQRVHDLNQDGVAFLVRRDYDRAEAKFEEARRLDPDHVATRFNLAAAAHHRGQWQRAEQGYLAVLTRQPDHPDAMHGLLRLMVQQGREGEARRVAEDWAVRKPDSADAHAVLGWLARLDGDLPAAQTRLETALFLNPKNSRALTELGAVYDELRYPDRARSLYRRALETNPQNLEAMYHLAKQR